ncbi:class I SAM-dependent DNA methyltransferase [Halobaculum lipolyticum]|uniref:Class I SAM-dependent DNA methyltransferase n=1 Tax=Halobaculum lipolyticum TaxID=3032001 RepID=A0ABD5W4V9_9EURY|nr:class I SAM-dependent methyltransferase [Halobaculum sp. DT31]
MPTFADACDAVLTDPGGDHSLYTTLAPIYERLLVTAEARYDAQVLAVTERVPTSARVVLNAGCGVGRLLPALADRHGAVVGLDASAELLSIAGGHVAAGEGVSLVEADVSDPETDLNRRFDAAVSFDYLTAHLHGAALDRGLATLRRHLHDGGTVVVDAVADRRALAEDSPSVFRDERYTAERAVDVVDAGDGTGDLIRIADYRVTDSRTGEGAVAREREPVRTFAAAELADALEAAGFRSVGVEADVVEDGSLVATARV